MELSSKVFESESLIRFSDCDPFNHLNNSRYLDYFINAREDQLTERGFDLYRHTLETGLGWVVTMSQISYLRPAMLNEKVVIESTLLEMKEKEVLVEMRMWNKEKSVLKSVLWSRFTHYNLKTQRSEVHSPDLITFFSPFENPLPVPTTFEERVGAIRNKTAQDIR
jgi:acyl-CoA thioester hydrolase